MSFRRTWTRRFFADELDVSVPFGWMAPYRDSGHKDPDTGRPLCFVAAAAPVGAQGTWFLREKINIRNVMPGTKQKVIGLSVKGLYTLGPWTIIKDLLANVKLKGDGAKIWESQMLLHEYESWAINVLTPNTLIDGYTELDVELWQKADIFTDSLLIHDAELTVQAEYFTDTPAPTASVRIDVQNKDTGAGVSKAYVALMSGAVIVVDGYTDGGTITFNNVDEGSYVVKIIASGYHAFDTAIDVIPPSVWYIAKLVPVPSVPLPWWALPVGIGVAVVFGLAFISRPKPTPIMVLK